MTRDKFLYTNFSSILIESPGELGLSSHNLWFPGRISELNREEEGGLDRLGAALGHDVLIIYHDSNSLIRPIKKGLENWDLVTGTTYQGLRNYLDLWYAGEYKWSDLNMLLDDSSGREKKADLASGTLVISSVFEVRYQGRIFGELQILEMVELGDQT